MLIQCIIKSPIAISLLLVFAIVSSCQRSNPLNSGLTPVEGGTTWIALNARINEYRQIALVDYNDPTNYKIITSNDHQNIYPRFSPDHSKLLFFDLRLGSAHSPQLVSYLLAEERTIFLSDSIEYPWGGLLANDPLVWNPQGTRVYHRFRANSFQDDIWYYDFITGRARPFTLTPYASERPIGLKGKDTLMVFSSDTPQTCGPRGFYFMDVGGDYLTPKYLGPITNPHLEIINRDGVNKKAPYNLRWNDEIRLFAFAQVDSSVSGYKIAVTDLDGTYYRTYTSGEYIDDYPIWGPGNERILFQRRAVTDYSEVNTRVMELDLATREVTEFVQPQVIGGATALSYPDY